MSEQTTENVMAILPDTFGNDKGGIGIKFAEDFHAHFLGIDEAMLLLFVERMGADDGPAFRLEGFGEDAFHFGLFGPAFLVGDNAKIAVGDEINLFRFEALHILFEAEASAR